MGKTGDEACQQLMVSTLETVLSLFFNVSETYLCVWHYLHSVCRCVGLFSQLLAGVVGNGLAYYGT